MQLMPFTGRKVADILKINGFETHSLLVPETNIQIGTRYLERLFDKFSGSVPLVAAAYNAGPQPLHAWVRNFGGLDMDKFIEHIPYIETRNYVKKVVRNQQIYDFLYNSDRAPRAMRLLVEPVGLHLTDPAPAKEIW